MLSNFLTNYETIYVIDKSATSFVFTYICYMLFFSFVLIAVACAYTFFKEKNKTDQGQNVVLGVGFVFAILAFFTITQTGYIKYKSIQNSRLNALCKTAKVDVYKIASDVESIYIDRNQTVRFRSGEWYLSSYDYISDLGQRLLGGSHLKQYEIKNIDYLTNNELRYIRVNELGEKYVGRLQAQYSILNIDASLEQDKGLDILGSDVKIINNKNNEVLAHFRYFWNKRNKEFCPANDGQLLIYDTIEYVLGFNMLEEGKHRVMEGLGNK